jgi:hypothetical protein
VEWSTERRTKVVKKKIVESGGAFMSFKLSPRTSTRGITMRMALRGPWGSPPSDSPDAQFLRSWLEHDSDADFGAEGGINWGLISGLTLAVGVSAIFWAGVGWMISRI